MFQTDPTEPRAVVKAPDQTAPLPQESTMDLTGSIEQALAPLSVSAYGSFIDNGGVGSSVLDAVLAAPLLISTTILELIAIAGRDVGSTITVP